MRLSLRTLRYALLIYAAFDFFIGGNCAGFLPLTALAAGQFTQVTGTVVDPNGLPYANGTIVPVLVVPSGAGSPTLGGLAYTPPIQPVGLNTAGFFLMQLGDNNTLLPASTKWNFQVCSSAGTIQPAGGKGPVCFSLAAPITITGTSQDISSNLNAVALALSTVSGGTPGGVNQQVQFNDNGVFGGAASALYDKTIPKLKLYKFPAATDKILDVYAEFNNASTTTVAASVAAATTSGGTTPTSMTSFTISGNHNAAGTLATQSGMQIFPPGAVGGGAVTNWTGIFEDATTSIATNSFGMQLTNFNTNPANPGRALKILGGSVSDSNGPLLLTGGAQPQLTLGAIGTASGQAALCGVTSGCANLTAPAVAGTTANPIASSNQISFPDNRGIVAADNPTGDYLQLSGISHNAQFNIASAFPAAVVSTGYEVNNASGFEFSNTGSPVGPIDAGLSRKAAGSVSFDTSTVGNGLGAGTNCRTTINVTPVTANTSTTADQNLMAFTLPANCLNTVTRTLRVFVAGVYSTAAASTAQMTLKIKICSVSGCGSGNVASVINITSAALGTLTITNNAWNGAFFISTQTGGAAGAWEAHGPFGIDEGALATAADSFFNDSNTATVTGSPAAIDTTAQNFLQVTFAFSAASASNSVTQRQLIIDSIN